MITVPLIKREKARIDRELLDLQMKCGDATGHYFDFVDIEVLPRRALNSGENPAFFMHFRCECCGLTVKSKVSQYRGSYVRNDDLLHHCHGILADFQKDDREHYHLPLHPFQDRAGYGVNITPPSDIPANKGKKWLRLTIERRQQKAREALVAKHEKEMSEI